MKKKKEKKLSFFKLFLFFLLLLILSVIVYFGVGTVKNGGGKSGLVATAMGQSIEELEDLETFSALLLGSSTNMTDTIMVFKYNPQTQKSYLISIPRDTFVGTSKENAKASEKINAIYRGQYPEKTLAAVNKITGLDLQYYVVIDTQALKALVDAIGGVWFDVPIDMKYTDKKQDLYIDLKAGYQLLDGDKAEQVVRFRHNQNGTSYSAEYGDNDIGRMKTQRNFLKAVMKQTLTPGNLLNIGKFIDIANTYVKTNIPRELLKQYVAPAVNFNTDNLETAILPGYSEKLNKIWFFLANSSKTKTLFTEMNQKLAKVEELDKEVLVNLKVEIVNGTGKTSALTQAKQILKDAGFTNIETSTTNLTEKTSILYNPRILDAFPNTICYLLDVSKSSVVSGENANNKITIILGKDF